MLKTCITQSNEILHLFLAKHEICVCTFLAFKQGMSSMLCTVLFNKIRLYVAQYALKFWKVNILYFTKMVLVFEQE